MTETPFWCKKCETLYENKCTCTKTDYIEYGPEWQKEMMKHTKAELIEMLRKAWIKIKEAKK